MLHQLFLSENEQTVFYDKYQQSNKAIAKGLLRHEKRFTTRASIQEAFKRTLDTPDCAPYLCLLSWTFVKNELQNDLNILGLDQRIVNQSKAVSEIVREGSVEEWNLYKNYLLLKEHKDSSSIELAQLLKCKPRLIRDWKNDLKKANICPGSVNNKNKTLPALSLPENPISIFKQCRRFKKKFKEYLKEKRPEKK